MKVSMDGWTWVESTNETLHDSFTTEEQGNDA
jgi:hypothetical protein